MLVRMLKSACGPHGSYQAGQQYELADDMAVAFLNAGAAVAVMATTEAAVAPAAETTARPATPKGKARAGVSTGVSRLSSRGDAA